jgi:phosphoribosylanthranilate isomerase
LIRGNSGNRTDMHREPRWSQPQARVLLKVCCIATPDEARLALELGADVLGLVSSMPSGPGVIPDDVITGIAAGLPATAESFLLTSRTDADGLIGQVRATGVQTLQLVDAVPPAVVEQLRASIDGVRLVQVIHVLDDESVVEALTALPLVDALLLDSGNPRLAVKELGGTGRVHDWSLSRRIRDEATKAGKPLFLAGGLRRENLVDAIGAVQPTGLDVCSGVRTDGQLDAAKLTAFVAALRSTDR